MIGWLTEHLGYLRELYRSADSPRRIALAVTLGMLLGLLPKDNLIAATLAVTVLAIRLNVAAAILSALAFSWLGYLLDALTHELGLALLTNTYLQPAWSRLYQLPLAAWTRFNNTVVLGSLTLGLATSPLAYLVTYRWVARRQCAAPECSSEPLSATVAGETAQNERTETSEATVATSRPASEVLQGHASEHDSNELRKCA